MRVFLIFALFILGATFADAQAPRPVLLEACNDAPFAIGVSAVFHNDPTDNQVVRGWFQVEPGECLEGGLGDIVGNDLGLGAVSGEWRWPMQDQGDEQYCMPAQTYFGRARSDGCDDVERLIDFQRVSISPYRSGWGRVQIRYSCEDFDAADAALCSQTATGRDGLAVPVNSLEVCNTWNVDAEIAAGASADFVGFEVSGWTRIPATLCRVVYRGFPAGGEVWFTARRADNHYAPASHEGQLCVAEGQFTASGARGALVNAGQCPANASIRLPAQRVRFGPHVAQYQAYVPRMEDGR